MYQFVLQSG